ncbi:hypothetical protein AK812_SmicGene8730 [Symbiodinium microadriaticum]|uniref:Uncharacterized protein n=1 Tax=Symbiodinium microadriaticum TaxID=2951 RepID=A0A1Q9EK85_SYMMI|nr:hypothetical protein AK812_SmicGene8730 [Symbiodinium microadriaticum]
MSRAVKISREQREGFHWRSSLAEVLFRCFVRLIEQLNDSLVIGGLGADVELDEAGQRGGGPISVHEMRSALLLDSAYKRLSSPLRNGSVTEGPRMEDIMRLQEVAGNSPVRFLEKKLEGLLFKTRLLEAGKVKAADVALLLLEMRRALICAAFPAVAKLDMEEMLRVLKVAAFPAVEKLEPPIPYAAGNAAFLNRKCGVL